MEINDIVAPEQDPAGTLAEFAAGLTFEDLPAEQVEFIKRDTLDMLGCLLAGSLGPSIPQVVSAARTWASQGSSKVMVYGCEMPAPLAGFVNGAMARALDMGDTGVRGGHVCEWIIPTLLTALSVSEKPISGKQFITAFAAGAEWGAREHITTHLQYHTIIPPGECAGSRYATVALAKMLGFDKEQIWNAAGMAYSAHSQHESQKYVEGTPDVRLQHGYVVENALKITELVRTGNLKSIHGIYMGHSGLLKHIKHGDLESPDCLTDELGTRWHWREGITEKTYTGCYYNHTPIWGVLSMMREFSIRREDVEHIHIVTSAGGITVHTPIEHKRRPQHVEQAMWSSPYTITRAVFTGDCFIDAFKPEVFEANMRDPVYTDFMDRITYECDPGIVTPFDNYPITITLKDGRVYHKVIDDLPGNQTHPLTWEQVIEKYRKCAKFAAKDLGEEKRQKAIDLCRKLDELDDVRPLFDTMVP